MSLRVFVLVCAIQLIVAKPHDGHQRGADKKLSDFDHFDEEVHDERYDHDALLGREDARRAESMSKKDSLNLLSDLVDQRDLDSDGFITEEELSMWIKGVAKKYIDEDVARSFDSYKEEFKTDFVTFENHKARLSDDYDEEEDSEDYDLKQAIERDKKRFDRADRDNDGKLTIEEFKDFLHPEESEHMHDIVIDETLEDLDKNHDGAIDLEEYTSDMWPDGGETPPEWVTKEQQQFRENRDKDGNGKLDRSEIEAWLFPAEYDYTETEVKHLISEADTDGDGKLSKEEILKNHKVFIGSQATEFGRALNIHEEL